MKFHRMALSVLAALGVSTAQSVVAGPIGYSAWDLVGNDRLVSIDLASGIATSIGNSIGFSDVDGLAFDASGVLYGVDDSTNKLITIDTTTGVGSAVGSGFGSGFNDMGLAFLGSTLFMSATNTSGSTGRLYKVDTSLGTATEVGSFAGGLKIRSLGAFGNVLYGWSNIDTLVKIDTATAAHTTVGAFGFTTPTGGQDGMDIDPATGTIWAVSEEENRTYTLDAGTGLATVYATSLTCDGNPCLNLANDVGFNSLAIAPVPEPESYALMLAGLGLVVMLSRRRKAGPEQLPTC